MATPIAAVDTSLSWRLTTYCCWGSLSYPCALQLRQSGHDGCRDGKKMKRLLGNPWFLLLFLTAIGSLSVGLAKGLATPLNQLIAGGLFGFYLGIANLIELYFSRAKWLSVFANGILGALTGVAMAYLLDKAPDQMIWYFLGGALLGASSRVWAKHINF